MGDIIVNMIIQYTLERLAYAVWFEISLPLFMFKKKTKQNPNESGISSCVRCVWTGTTFLGILSQVLPDSLTFSDWIGPLSFF